MANRGLRARFRYRSDEFLKGGAGRQLFVLFVLSLSVVVAHAVLAFGLSLVAGGLDGLPGQDPDTSLIGEFFELIWFFFTRILDAGTMGGDDGWCTRVLATFDTLIGVIVAGLLISSLAGNFQDRLDNIRRTGSDVVERDHFLILGWSEKVFAVIDQIGEAYASERIKVVVMAEGDKLEMEAQLADKVTRKRVKMVVRVGSSESVVDLGKVSMDRARAIVVLLDDADRDDSARADGRVIKTLLAIYHHPELRRPPRVVAEVMSAQSQHVATIASGGQAHVVKTNEIISKILLQTARIRGLAMVYDELLRFEGNEIHFKSVPKATGRFFGEMVLDFPNACLVGVAKADGSAHILNPPANHILSSDDQLLLLAEDANIRYQPYNGPLNTAKAGRSQHGGAKRVEHLLVLGWNEKIFPIVQEFDNYVASGSTMTLVNLIPEETRKKLISENCKPFQNIDVRHLVGEFTKQNVLDALQPQHYPVVLVLGDHQGGGTAEEADTRAIIALLLLRDYRAREGVQNQEVVSEILDPKNRRLAATTQINDIIISNQMISMLLAQVTYEPRVRAVLEDLFQSEGSEVYLKPMEYYAPLGASTTFEALMLAARARKEVALGMQVYVPDPTKRFGLQLNPGPKLRQISFAPKPGDRLIVLAEDDG